MAAQASRASSARQLRGHNGLVVLGLGPRRRPRADDEAGADLGGSWAWGEDKVKALGEATNASVPQRCEAQGEIVRAGRDALAGRLRPLASKLAELDVRLDHEVSASGQGAGRHGRR